MTFEYAISDTCVPGTSKAKVTLIYPSPGGPLASNDAYTCTYNAPCTPGGQPDPLANDRSLTGCPINMSAITQPSVGSVTFTPNGQFTYTPPQ
jgi:hypothetical protein